MGIKERFMARTPPFFRKLRTFGLALVAAGGAIATSREAMPEFMTQASGYLIVAGSVIVAVSQAVVEDKE